MRRSFDRKAPTTLLKTSSLISPALGFFNGRSLRAVGVTVHGSDCDAPNDGRFLRLLQRFLFFLA
jgi:hypothetical protein